MSTKVETQMKFQTQISDLVEALALASVVKPVALNASVPACYLLVPKGDVCFIYSEDQHQKSRVSFPIRNLEEDETGDSSFALPVESTSGFKYLDGELTVEHSKEGDTFMVKWSDETGAEVSRPTFDPYNFQALDQDFESASDGPTFSTTMLREALSAARSWVADPKASGVAENFKSVQIFDDSKPEWESGNGVLFAANGYRAMYFYCEDFLGKGLGLHGLRIPLLTSFLSKSEGNVTLKRGTSSTYFVNSQGQVVGWSDVVTETSKFAYGSLAKDTHVIRVPKEHLVRALSLVRSELDPRKDIVRFQYNHQQKTLQFLASDDGKSISSRPVGVVPLDSEDGSDAYPIKGGELSKSQDFSCNVNLDWMLELVTPVKGQEVELRFYSNTSKKGNAIRTLETFFLDEKGKVRISKESSSEERVFTCQVTRFIPSKN